MCPLGEREQLRDKFLIAYEQNAISGVLLHTAPPASTLGRGLAIHL